MRNFTLVAAITIMAVCFSGPGCSKVGIGPVPVLAQVAIPAAGPMPIPRVQFLSAAGAPLANGTITTYAAGTTTPLATYTDSTAGTPNANPIVLDSGGFADIWLSAASYKILAKNSGGVTQWTVDNVSNIGLLVNNNIAIQVLTKDLNNVKYANQFAGADAAAKINACLVALPAGGGVCDARGLTGAQTLGTNMFAGIDKQFSLILGNATFTATAGQIVALSNGNFWDIQGEGWNTILTSANTAVFDLLTLTTAGAGQIRNLRMFQSDGGSTTKAAIRMTLVNDVSLRGLWIYGFYDGVYIDRSSNISMIGNLLEAGQRACVYGDQMSLSQIIGNTFYKCAETVALAGASIIGTKQAAFNYPPSGNAISGNYFLKSNYGPHITLTEWESTAITGNKFSVAGQLQPGDFAEITLAKTIGISITGNVFHWSDNEYIAGSRASKYCVDLAATTQYTTVTGNHCEMGETAGINDAGFRNTLWGNLFTFSAVVNTSGAVVTWVNGRKFTGGEVGLTARINGVSYTVLTYDSPTQLTLTASAGVQTNSLYSIESSVETNKLRKVVVSDTSTFQDTATFQGSIFATGGTDVSINAPAMRMNNSRLLAMLDSAGGTTNAAFLYNDASNTLQFGISGQSRFRMEKASGSSGAFIVFQSPVFIGDLGAGLVDGTMGYCTTCKGPADAGWTAGMACSGAAPATGALAVKVAGVWRCN